MLPAPPFRLARGIPQGLSASVLLGEVFLCALIWKVHWAGAAIIGHVDDLHLLSTQRPVFIRILQILDEFLEAFSLQLNRGKSGLWGTDSHDLDRLSEYLGIPHVSVLTSLGLTFPLQAGPFESTAENTKLAPLIDKLKRIEHMPAPLGIKRGAIAVGVLSTLDYGGPVSPKDVMPLRLAVKKAMGIPQGAPEVVYHLTGKGTIDPLSRWFITGLRSWHYTRLCEDWGTFLGNWTSWVRNSRISELRSYANSLGWSLDPTDIVTPFRMHSWAWEWKVLRPRLAWDLKRTSWRQLAERRPRIYHGLDQVDVHAHANLLASLNSYHAKVIFRVWAGVPMTKQHRHTLSEEVDPICGCGLEAQTIEHLLLRCPELEPPTLELTALESMPTCVKAALILPLDHAWHWKPIWKLACRRIITILTKDKLPTRLTQEHSWDRKGHIPVVTCCGLYSYCALCHISRRIRDMKFIATSACLKKGETPILAGNYKREGSHICRLTMATWKRSSQRPRYECVFCRRSWWATGPSPPKCTGA